MTSIKNPPHPRTMAEIKSQPLDSHSGHAQCGCHQRGEETRWWLCEYHLGLDEGWSERDDVIKDVTDRIERAIFALTGDRTESTNTNERWRLYGKIEGMAIIQGWLRDYPSITNEEAD